jgi:hypothetical protein
MAVWAALLDRSPWRHTSCNSFAGSTKGSSSIRMMDDRRSIGRTKIGKNSLLFFGAQTGVHPCTVADITNTGAGILTQDLAAISLNFRIVLR